MRYYKELNEDDSIKLIGTGENGGIEITETEYNEQLEIIKAKAQEVDEEIL